jgi:hypothetical protein
MGHQRQIQSNSDTCKKQIYLAEQQHAEERQYTSEDSARAGKKTNKNFEALLQVVRKWQELHGTAACIILSLQPVRKY